MVKRRGLADMLRTEAQHLQPSLEETDSVISVDTESQSLYESTALLELPTLPTDAAPDSIDDRDTESISYRETESVSLPKYQRLVRKEARLHEAQYDELTRLARELNRRKREVGEIITANTLLRVATELLLRRRSELQGDTEEELLASLH